jgi:hypothetical protein
MRKTSITVDLREALTKFFPVRGNENPSVQDQEIVAASWGLKKQFVEMTKEDRKNKQNKAMLKEREIRRGKFSNFELRLADAWAKRNSVEINSRNQEYCVHAAQSEYDEQLREADEARKVGQFMQETYERREADRWKKLLTQPYPADGVGKDFFSWPLERLNDAQVEEYGNYSTNELRQMLDYAITIAEQELFPVVFDIEQRRLMTQFMTAQQPPLSPIEAQNWIVAFKILELEGASKELPTHTVDLSVPEPPPLPVRNDGPVNPHKPGSLEAKQFDRDEMRKGVEAEIDAVVGPIFQELADQSGKSIDSSLVKACVADLQTKNLPFTRYNLRRSFAYLRADEVPPGTYTRDELDQFEADRAEQMMSADQYKKLNYRRSA